MNEIKVLLGRRIKELREKRNLTQQQMAELVGVDQRNLSKIECGVTFPSKSLAEIARALQVSLPQLFNFEHLGITIDNKKDFIKTIVDKLEDDKIEILYRLIRTFYE